MTQSKEILATIEFNISVYEKAKAEREGALNALCSSCGVKNWQDIDDVDLFNSALEIDFQIEMLDFLIGDLKISYKHIKKSFKDI